MDARPGAIATPAPKIVLDNTPGGKSWGTSRHAPPVRKLYKIALTISRLGYASSLPPGLAAGMSGARICHALSRRSVGEGCRDFILRCYRSWRPSSHFFDTLSDPERLSRLLTASCLAYIWVVYSGAPCRKERWVGIIHRSDRCDLSLFQLGLRLLDHFLNENSSIPVAFHIVIEESKSKLYWSSAQRSPCTV
jgi:hypothetical protein